MATLRQTFSDIADAIRAKGVSGTFKPIDMASKIGEIQTGGGSEPTNQRVVFAHDQRSTSIVVPNTIVVDMMSIDNLNNLFYNCTALTSISLPEGFGRTAVNIGACFAGCQSLKSLVLPDGFGQNAQYLVQNFVGCFYNCTMLESLHLPSGFGLNANGLQNCFNQCLSLKTITGNPNFKVSLNLSSCTKLTHDSIMVIINGLQTVTTTQTLSLGSTNLAKLTEADKKIATDKGWTLA